MSKKSKAMKTLRKAAKQARSRVMDSVPWGQRLLLWTTMQMAERGPGFVQTVRERVGGDPMPGHLIDTIMNAAAGMEQAALSGDTATYEEALLVVLFLSRHLAYQQGKMTTVVAPASPEVTQ